MTKLKYVLTVLKSFIPGLLPVGITEFTAWSNDIILLTNFADVDSLRFAIASMVIHLPANTWLISKHHFVRGLRKSAANQVASQVFQDIKQAQENKHKLAEDSAKQQAESCPPTTTKS